MARFETRRVLEQYEEFNADFPPFQMNTGDRYTDELADVISGELANAFQRRINTPMRVATYNIYSVNAFNNRDFMALVEIGLEVLANTRREPTDRDIDELIAVLVGGATGRVVVADLDYFIYEEGMSRAEEEAAIAAAESLDKLEDRVFGRSGNRNRSAGVNARRFNGGNEGRSRPQRQPAMTTYDNARQRNTTRHQQQEEPVAGKRITNRYAAMAADVPTPKQHRNTRNVNNRYAQYEEPQYEPVVQEVKASMESWRPTKEQPFLKLYDPSRQREEFIIENGEVRQVIIDLTSDEIMKENLHRVPEALQRKRETMVKLATENPEAIVTNLPVSPVTEADIELSRRYKDDMDLVVIDSMVMTSDANKTLGNMLAAKRVVNKGHKPFMTMAGAFEVTVMESDLVRKLCEELSQHTNDIYNFYQVFIVNKTVLSEHDFNTVNTRFTKVINEIIKYRLPDVGAYCTDASVELPKLASILVDIGFTEIFNKEFHKVASKYFTALSDPEMIRTAMEEGSNMDLEGEDVSNVSVLARATFRTELDLRLEELGFKHVGVGKSTEIDKAYTPIVYEIFSRAAKQAALITKNKFLIDMYVVTNDHEVLYVRTGNGDGRILLTRLGINNYTL